jgi:hypothetical protein
MFRYQLLHLDRIEVSGDRHRSVVGRIIGAEEILGIVERCRAEVGH